MFIALRRFTLVCTIVLERSLMHKQHDRATLGAVALMIGGKAFLLPWINMHNSGTCMTHACSGHNDKCQPVHMSQPVGSCSL